MQDEAQTHDALQDAAIKLLELGKEKHQDQCHPTELSGMKMLQTHTVQYCSHWPHEATEHSKCD